MSSEPHLQTMVTKVPLELLFTDFIDEEHKTVLIPHYTDAWYEVHKRYGDLPIARLTPHLQLFRYLMGQGEYPKLYLDWHASLFTTRDMEVPISDYDILEHFRLQYRTMAALFANDPEYFNENPVLVEYDRKGGYFHVKDGHHRAIFQYCSGVRKVPARMIEHDYEFWKHTDVVNQVTEVFSRHLRTLIYTPIMNPHFMHLKSERDDVYPTRMDLIMEYLGSSSVRGKRVIDIGCNIGFYARHFTRQGAIVTGYEPLAEHYELARQLNVLERVHFDLKEERFERSTCSDTCDIGLLLTVFYHLMDDVPVREAFLRKLDQSVTGMLFWESGAEPEKEKAILLAGTHFDRYEKLADTEGTGKKREFGVFLKSSYNSGSYE
ncbi:class I SAM-dependent methyltransferase [Paenibacillus lautus]|uniref:class I SAM-dependent methyltransferase n=1 Tax=Paenibacillus lautus TaxID=1401 RepID=UPI001FE25C93|nr:methyltransferase domain-containing protein [Paenibacillus lautus]